MYYKCYVPGCVSSRQNSTLHKFPKSAERLRKWLDSINCDSLRNLSARELGDLQVCHKHFEARFVTKKSRLLSIAYPTLFQQSEILSGIPITHETNVTKHCVDDHHYAKKMHNDHNYFQVKPAGKSQSLKHTNVILSTSKVSQSNVECDGQQVPYTSDILPSSPASEASDIDYVILQEPMASDVIPSTSNIYQSNIECHVEEQAAYTTDIFPSSSASEASRNDYVILQEPMASDIFPSSSASEASRNDYVILQEPMASDIFPSSSASEASLNEYLILHKPMASDIFSSSSTSEASRNDYVILQEPMASDIFPSSSASEAYRNDYVILQEPMASDIFPSSSASEASRNDYVILQEPMASDIFPPSPASEASRNDYVMLQEPMASDSTLKRRKIKPSAKTIPKAEALTPKYRILYNKYRKTQKLLSFTRRSKKAMQFSKANAFEEMTVGMNPLAKQLLSMQVKLCRKKEKARRFTLDEKLIALSIFKEGPKSYSLLQKIFILPSVTTLKKMLEVPTQTGLVPPLCS